METQAAEVVPYEQRLRLDRRWDWAEGDRYFQGKSAPWIVLRTIARRLDAMGIPYALAGAQAMLFHGYRRLTINVNLVVTRPGLEAIHAALVGDGFVLARPGGRSLRDAEYGVLITFLVTGEYPGDGLPKPVAFPDPASVAIDCDGLKVLSLPSLVELKLASGMTNFGRMKDLGDVVEMIKTIPLSAGLADLLNPFVRDRYVEYWTELQEIPPGPDSDEWPR